MLNEGCSLCVRGHLFIFIFREKKKKAIYFLKYNMSCFTEAQSISVKRDAFLVRFNGIMLQLIATCNVLIPDPTTRINLNWDCTKECLICWDLIQTVYFVMHIFSSQ